MGMCMIRHGKTSTNRCLVDKLQPSRRQCIIILYALSAQLYVLPQDGEIRLSKLVTPHARWTDGMSDVRSTVCLSFLHIHKLTVIDQLSFLRASNDLPDPRCYGRELAFVSWKLTSGKIKECTRRAMFGLGVGQSDLILRSLCSLAFNLRTLKF